ncbi:hypothetical protein GCM10012275_50380 [Longimycelium tulufanense]|uniref:Uncharacterized protein n=1 Tax=Longimycelium tulufanense TaxID=907463 RepID=A0A8J3FYP1_9PSEU|nr:hypothetical protein [Longimycelium tulufanense]GGM73589.1 hypothetical protein GCM10012275_50380 [Longimycelium tulufanense]
MTAAAGVCRDQDVDRPELGNGLIHRRRFFRVGEIALAVLDPAGTRG